jgi:hypothetical protein
MAPVFAVATTAKAGRELPEPYLHGSSLLLTGGRRSINKVVSFAFGNDAPEPELVVKHARVPEAIASLHREATTLQVVERRHPHVRGVPRVVFHDQLTGQLGETVLRGTPLFAVLNRGNFAMLARQATDWLARLAGDARPQPRAVWWPRLAGPVLDMFAERFGPIVDGADIERSRRLLQALDALPVVCEQRDFSPWNVLIDGAGDLVVLDWESAETEGLPALDLIYFLTYLGFFVEKAIDSGRHREAYRAMRDPESFTGRVWQECVGRYCARVRLSPTALRPLRLLTWMLHAQSEYRAFTTDIAGSPPVELLRRSLFVQLWQAELESAT